MTAPITSKVWTVTPNKRNSFTTMVDMMAWCLFENKVAMKLAGWTVKFSSDGVTGPSSGADTTDRWTARANAGVRGTVANAAQSWIVLQNADGVQVLLAYQAAGVSPTGDDIARIAYSPKVGYVLAGTTTFQPTATDEVICSSAATIVNSTASADRTMTIWCSNDTKNWSFIVFRASAIVCTIGVEIIVNACAPFVFGDGVTDTPYVGYRYTSLVRSGNTSFPGTINPMSGLLFGVTGAIARVFTAGTSKTIRIGGGGIGLCYEGNAGGGPSNGFYTSANVSELNNGAPTLPIVWSSFITAGATGVLGYPIDWWQLMTTSTTPPALGDFSPGYEVGDTPGVSALRSNWFVTLGGAMVRPWRNAAATLDIA